MTLRRTDVTPAAGAGDSMHRACHLRASREAALVTPVTALHPAATPRKKLPPRPFSRAHVCRPGLDCLAVPTFSLTPAPHAAAADYCRQARRLRARFNGDPARLQAALRELAHSTDRRPRTASPDDSLDPFTPAGHPTPGPARLFTSRVAAALDAGVLRYSARKDLLREAARMGLGNFEATLLIAAVQHGEQRAVRPATRTPSISSSSFTPLIALAAIVLQTAIVGTAWWLFHA
jgi:hypothetical protein